MPFSRITQLKKWMLTFTLTAAAVCTQSTFANSIGYELNTMIPKYSPAKIGVMVQSMQTGQILYSRNANTFFAPASVQKLLTVTSALIHLTPQYRFPTRVMTYGSIQQGVLNGDLIFQFNGDPSLKVDDLVNLVKSVRADGIDRINGNVIIDDTAFNHIPYPAGWLWSDLITDFAAPLDTVIINRNKFGLSFIPARYAGERPELVPDMPYGAATFINHMKTTNYYVGNCPVSILSNEENQYLLRGCISKHAGKQYRTLAIRNMQMFTESLMREILLKHGIQFTGKIYAAKTPARSQLLTEHFSAPLKVVIIHLLKESDNLYADALFKKLGENCDHSRGSWQNGVQAVLSILSTHIGINPSQVSIVDGSGLSLYDKITPNDIAKTLFYIHTHPTIRNALVPALPIAGVDGTLAYRMGDLARGHLVHAKTGSMTGVSSLAGFVKTRSHGLLSFVIMINNVPKDRWPYIVLENHIVEYLARS